MTEIDDSKVMQTLTNLERNLNSQQHKRAFARSARKGGNFLKAKVKSMIPDSDKFPHVDHVKRSIIVKNAKTFRSYPGVNVTIKKSEVPVSPGKGRDWWDVRGYAYLIMFGSYQNQQKHGRPGGGSKERKGVKGIAPNNVFKQVQDQNGKQAISLTLNHFIGEIEKEIAKSVVK